MNYQWVDPHGISLDTPWPARSQWVWKYVPQRDTPDAPKQRLVIRTWVEVLPPYVFRSAKATSSSVSVSLNPSEPKLEATHHGTLLQIDSDEALTTVVVSVKDAHGVPLDISMILQSQHQQTLLWNPGGTCDALGVRIETHRGDPRFLYAVASCEDRGDAFDLEIRYSPDAYMERNKIERKISEGAGWIRWRLNKPAKSDEAGVLLGGFQIMEREGLSFANTGIYYSFSNKTSRLNFGGGLGMTYINYNEQPYQLTLPEIGLTGKASVSYQLFPGIFDVSLGGYLTLLPLSYQATPVPLSRFYGLNSRFNFELPTLLGLQWNLAAGYYFWGMLVPGGVYGIASLTGPQAMVTARSIRVGPKSYYAYVKFAPISDTPGLGSLSNRELAGGAGYTMDAWIYGRYWTVTLDVSNAQFVSPSQGNGLNLTTFSLGVQAPF